MMGLYAKNCSYFIWGNDLSLIPLGKCATCPSRNRWNKFKLWKFKSALCLKSVSIPLTLSYMVSTTDDGANFSNFFKNCWNKFRLILSGLDSAWHMQSIQLSIQWFLRLFHEMKFEKMSSNINLVSWFSHSLDVCTQKSRWNFVIYWWNKTNQNKCRLQKI